MNIWQIATGETGRDYRRIFFDYDVMALGPGMYGDAYKVDYADGVPNSAKSQVHNFAHLPKPGDRVIMRFGKEIIGVGQIPSGKDSQYLYHEAFRCVYGWDLRHCQRVVWAKDVNLKDFKGAYADTKRKPSFTQVHEKAIVDKVKAFDDKLFDRSLKSLPKAGFDEYSYDELGTELFKAGMSNKNIEDILKALEQADRLWWWYDKENKGRPSEQEIISHMILPIFLGLGWSHQQMAVEWQKVDVAFFKNMPAQSENAVMILEAKGWGQALTEAFSQPQGYIKSLDLKRVKCIVLTDGANIFLYGKKKNCFCPEPIGYINIWSLQKQYLLPKNTSIAETLVKLQPSAM